MIYVDQLRKCGAPWHGGVACHMISDASVHELSQFARAIGLSESWFQPRGFPHYDLAPRYRAMAVRYGALECDRRAYVEAMRRFRAANRDYFLPRLPSDTASVSPSAR
jgi:hypothetical protein